MADRMDYKAAFRSAVERVKSEGRYRVFTDLELRKVGALTRRPIKSCGSGAQTMACHSLAVVATLNFFTGIRRAIFLARMPHPGHRRLRSRRSEWQASPRLACVCKELKDSR